MNQPRWDAGSATRDFGRRNSKSPARDAATGKVARLQADPSTATSWKRVIDDFDQQDRCSMHGAFNHQLKCPRTSPALRHALEGMPAKTWPDCCKDAVKGINQTDEVEHVHCKETVSRWHLTFRRNNEAFPNPHTHSAKASLPPLLDCYPELARRAPSKI